ncbi:energy coupling factor transporter S component ThiW [Mesobacillus harenae]|uniref:energy coupling factor transporter S component ThiW n=1 Tax=Mesobacillus harenae TaxID=2213203 RepID=UPI00157FDBC0|nr:energy coupling factor transporter S component ThiW [Mesobacillus harenae]
MRKTQKLTLTAMMVAIGTLTSHMFYIPVGFAKVFPMQHLINVLSAVLLGPYYAVAQALTVSLLRNMMGTGSLFAFPGSMIGALLASFVYLKTRKLYAVALGEVFGTGILGAIASYPIAVLLLGREATLFGFLPAFLFSSLAGASIGYMVLAILNKNAGRVLQQNSTYTK